MTCCHVSAWWQERSFMLEAKTNKEILKIKTSMLGFTPGQVASITVGLIAGSITYFVLPVPDFCKIPVIAVIVVFICSFGFVTMDGMNVDRSYRRCFPRGV